MKKFILFFLLTWASGIFSQYLLRENYLQMDLNGNILTSGIRFPFWGIASLGDSTRPVDYLYINNIWFQNENAILGSSSKRIGGLFVTDLDFTNITGTVNSNNMSDSLATITSQHRTYWKGSSLANLYEFPFWGEKQVGTLSNPADAVYTNNLYGDYSFTFSRLDSAARMMAQYSLDTLNIISSDKIFVYGDSYLEGALCQLDENAVSKFSRYSDFNVENHAKSGDHIGDVLNHFYDDDPVRNYPISTAIMKPTYCIIQVAINDPKGDPNNLNQFKTGYEKAILEMLACGSIPIIVPPGKNYGIETAYPSYAFAQREMAFKYKLHYIDALKLTMGLTSYNNNISWILKTFALDGSNSHPNAMSAWYWSNACNQYLAEKIKPNKAIKIWRPDSLLIDGLSIYDSRDTLRFHDRDSKLDNFHEIHLSQKYGDIHVGDGSVEQASEYAALVDGDNISFDDYALVEFTVPFTVNDLRSEIVFSAGVSSANYNVFVYKWWNTNNDTTYFNTIGYDLGRAFVWDSLGTYSSATSISETIGASDVDKYIQGNKIFYLIEETGGGTFNLSSSPSLIYHYEKNVLPVVAQNYLIDSEEIITPYFDAAGVSSWTMTGANVEDGDAYFWKFPGVVDSVEVRTPAECDDSLVVIGNNDDIYKLIDLSAYEYGDEFRLEIISQNEDTTTHYNKDNNSLKVDLHHGGTYPAGDDSTLTKTLDVYPVWMKNEVMFRKVFGIDSLYVTLSKNDTLKSDILVSKVGLKKVEYFGKRFIQ